MLSFLKVDDVPTLIDDDTANAIEFYLIQNGYVDMKRKVTDKYREEIKNGAVAELPDELKPMAEGIHTLIQAVYDDSILKDMFTDGHETKVKDNPLRAIVLNIIRSFVLNTAIILVLPNVFNSEIVWFTFGIYESLVLAVSMSMLVASIKKKNAGFITP